MTAIRGKKTIGFEQSLGELESLVKMLEQGDLPLEEALCTFEKGLKLAQTCQKTLQTAELKVTKLIEGDDQNFQEVPFHDLKDDNE